MKWFITTSALLALASSVWAQTSKPTLSAIAPSLPPTTASAMVSQQPSNQPPVQVIVSPSQPESPVAMYTAVGVALISLGGLLVTALYYRRQLRQQDVKDLIDHTQKLLDSFYGPLRTLKQSNRHLHDMLKLREVNGVVESESYALLERLLAKHPFSANQRALIKTIIENNKLIDKLISDHCGAIESEVLQERVHKFCAHHHVIEAAFKEEISGEFWRFKDFVYPNGLDEAINAEIDRLQKALDALRSAR